MRTHIYARVSTEGQAEKGYSLDTQLEACRKKAAEIGATEVTEYVESFTATETDRPEFIRLREAIDNKIVDAIVFHDPDRLFRKQAYQGLFIDDMRKSGIKVHFCTIEYHDDPEGRLMLGVRGAVAEYELEKIKERTMRGKRGKAKKGYIVHNTRPFGLGWDPERMIYTENEDSELVRSFFRLVNEGKSITSIVRRLNAQGVPSPEKKGVWHPATVTRILHNVLYTGEAVLFRQKREKIDGKWVETERDPSEWIRVPSTAIVSREEFDAAQKAITQQKKFSPRKTKGIYMLQNIGRCGICHRPMMIAMRGKQIHYYVCASHRLQGQTGEDHCGARGVRTDLLDDYIWDKLSRIIKKPNRIKALIEEKKQNKRTTKTLENLRKREKELLDEQGMVMRYIRQKKLDEFVGTNQLDEINLLLSEVRKRINDFTATANLLSLDDRINNFMAAFQNAENRRDACQKAIESVYITRTDTNVGRYADTEVDVKIIPK